MKIYLITLLSFFSVNLFAQLETSSQYSNWIVGSEFNFFTSNNNEARGVISNDLKLKTTSFTIAPYIGNKLNANWLVGLQIGYKKTDEVEDYIIGLGLDPSTGFTNTTVIAEEANQKEFFVATFARRYFRLTDKIQAFVHTSLGYSIQNKDDIYIEDTKDWSFSLGVSPGISWNLSKRISIISKFSSISFRFGKQKRAAYDSGIILNNTSNTGSNTPVIFEGSLGNYAIPGSEDGIISGTPFTRIIQPALDNSYYKFDANFGLSSFLIGFEFKW